MTDLRVMANVTPGRATSDGNWMAARALRDGTLSVADFALVASMEGRVFAANMGVVTSPVTTAATTAITNTIAHAWIRVPDGTVAFPLYASLVIESSAATTQIEGSILTCNNDIGTSGAAAAVGPVALNQQAGVTSSCFARQLATASTAPTTPIELTRFSAAASAVNQRFEWNAQETLSFPVVRGAGTWAIYLGGNAVVYYDQMVWAEDPENFVS